MVRRSPQTTDLKHRGRSRSAGQSMVEFAMVAPVLFLVLIAIFQFGIAFTDYIQVTNAARDGARKALVSRSDPNAVSTVQTAVKNSTWSLNTSQLGITVTPGTPWTAGQDVTVTVSYPYSISIMGLVVGSGTLKSTTTARIE
jgi:Flp pilus assembly protein TadG